MSAENKTNDENTSHWKKCSSCKKPILFNKNYYVCSVSTCNGQRTGYTFCSVMCFESHLPGARHREAGAIEKLAPKGAEASVGPQRLIVRPSVVASVSAASLNASRPNAVAPNEVLIIASRLKDFIQAKSDFNTSASVMDVLSDHVRILCERAIDNARSEGRKTVLDRDFDFLKGR